MEQVFYALPVRAIGLGAAREEAYVTCCAHDCLKTFPMKDGKLWVYFNGNNHVNGIFCCHRCALESLVTSYMNSA